MRTKILALLPRVAFVLMIATHTCFSQQTSLNSGCDLAVLGATEARTFLVFDQALRNAVTKNDAGAVALLVRFPLRVYGIQGTWFVNDPESLRLRFHEIFPAGVRDAVLNERPSTVQCNWIGIRYGSGEVWVKPQVADPATEAEATAKHYLVESINLPSLYDAIKNQAVVTVKLVCQTDHQWVIIDDGANGRLRYRAWNKPHTLADKPDLTMATGRKESAGAGPCTHSVWTFSGGTTEVIVEGLGCHSDVNGIPEGSKARLEVSSGGKAETPLWCY